mmetsp:Transcript_58973/g.117181  ORF Transcript_58973/g.117181 Transcript_58973/m.117181 type:complete len:87 (+) Transcript_58973:176-436(+)
MVRFKMATVVLKRSCSTDAEQRRTSARAQERLQQANSLYVHASVRRFLLDGLPGSRVEAYVEGCVEGCQTALGHINRMGAMLGGKT